MSLAPGTRVRHRLVKGWRGIVLRAETRNQDAVHPGWDGYMVSWNEGTPRGPWHPVESWAYEDDLIVEAV